MFRGRALSWGGTDRANRLMKVYSRYSSFAMRLGGCLAAFFAIATVASAEKIPAERLDDGRPPPILSHRPNTPSTIRGDCDCDTASGTTTCTYTVLSGRPALSHLVFPIVPDCVEDFTISSEFFDFKGPDAFYNPHCGEIFGIKNEHGMADGQVETFTITYDAIYPTGIVYAILKSGPYCEAIPVPGVIDCPFVPCVKWAVDGTRFDFFVRKPGDYTALMAKMAVTANIPVTVSFASFEDLTGMQNSPPGMIPTFYAITGVEQAIPPGQFLPPAVFNQLILTVPGDEQTFEFALWTKILVGTQITACEYNDAAIITLVLENNTTWSESLKDGK